MQNARVAKWQTHYLEVVAPKGVEVRLLSRALAKENRHYANKTPSGTFA